MSTDLSPLGDLAAETRAAPVAAPGEGQTLTLSLRIARPAGTEAMAGRLSLRATEAPLPGLQHVRIVPAPDAAPLTITFF
jgi:hypothetical protein